MIEFGINAYVSKDGYRSNEVFDKKTGDNVFVMSWNDEEGTEMAEFLVTILNEFFRRGGFDKSPEVPEEQLSVHKDGGAIV